MKNLWMILIIGIILRIFLSLATFHSDTLAFKLGGGLIATGKILNLYDYSNSDVAILNYPPAIYLFHGIFNFLLGAFLSTGLLVKMPYLIFDLLTGYFLFKLFASKRQADLAFILWIFNPVNLYATYMMGQFDIIPTFFIVFSLFLISKKREDLAALALGGGIAFKIFPIFLIIPLVYLGKTFSAKIKLLIFTLLPYFLSIIPYINSSNFRSTALFASQSDKSLYAALQVSGGEAILFFPAFLILFYLIIQNKVKEFNLWRFYLIPLLLFFIFTHYHPQWFIWLTPFLIMDLTFNRFKNILPILLILGSWLLSLFFFDPSLTIGLFAPILPNLDNAPSVWNLLNLNMDYDFSRSLLQTVLAGASGYLIYHHFTKSNA